MAAGSSSERMDTEGERQQQHVLEGMSRERGETSSSSPISAGRSHSPASGRQRVVSLPSARGSGPGATATPLTTQDPLISSGVAHSRRRHTSLLGQEPAERLRLDEEEEGGDSEGLQDDDEEEDSKAQRNDRGVQRHPKTSFSSFAVPLSSARNRSRTASDPSSATSLSFPSGISQLRRQGEPPRTDSPSSHRDTTPSHLRSPSSGSPSPAAAPATSLITSAQGGRAAPSGVDPSPRMDIAGASSRSRSSSTVSSSSRATSPPGQPAISSSRSDAPLALTFRRTGSQPSVPTSQNLQHARTHSGSSQASMPTSPLHTLGGTIVPAAQPSHVVTLNRARSGSGGNTTTSSSVGSAPIAISGSPAPPASSAYGVATSSSSMVAPISLPIGTAPISSRISSSTPFLPSPLAQASLAPGEEDVEFFGLDEPATAREERRSPRAIGGSAFSEWPIGRVS